MAVHSSNRTLIAGFAIILSSVAVLVALIFEHLNTMDEVRDYNRVLQIKTTAAHRMAESIRNRNFSLAVTPSYEDFFDRDDEKQRFAGYAREFLKEREKLMASGLDAVETKAFAMVIERIRDAQPVVEAAMDLAVEDGGTTEVQERVSGAWQTQTDALKALDNFTQVVNAQAQRRTAEADRKMRLNLQFAVGLGFVVLVLCAITAFIVTRREAHSRNALVLAADEITNLNERLQEENLRISSELNVAKKLQEMVLPNDTELTAITELDIAAHMSPAEEVGGDYYDVLQCCDGHVLVGIGDVTGHGLESGVIMLMVQSMVRALMETGKPELRGSLATINQVIYRNSARMSTDKNLTLAVIHYYDGKIRIAGQHEEVLVIRQGNMERVDTIDLGFPIGIEENITPFISEYSTHLDAGDVVVLYTDGITEAENSEGELYGMNPMFKVIKEHWSEPAEIIRTALIEDVNAFIGDSKVHDDVTLVVIKRC